MLAEYTCEEIALGLDCLIAETLAAAAIAGPPVNAFAVADALGVAVAVDDRQATRARYVRLQTAAAPQPTILVRPEPRAERRQWAVAHELGEHLAGRVFHDLGIDPRIASPTAREAVASQLAGRLLAPSEWLLAAGRQCRWDLFTLKEQFATASHELLARRTLECGPPAIVTIFDHGRAGFRRGNFAGRVPPPSAAELQCWRRTHAANRPQQAADDWLLVRGWPIHEDGWKREILRSELKDAD
jgi:hypothetical protein